MPTASSSLWAARSPTTSPSPSRPPASKCWARRPHASTWPRTATRCAGGGAHAPKGRTSRAC
eukprot:2638656-Prymnesium_polylepis.1